MFFDFAPSGDTLAFVKRHAQWIDKKRKSAILENMNNEKVRLPLMSELYIGRVISSRSQYAHEFLKSISGSYRTEKVEDREDTFVRTKSYIFQYICKKKFYIND